MKALKYIFALLLLPLPVWAECAFVDFDADSNIIRVKAIDITDGQGHTGLSSASAGLVLSVIANNQAAAAAAHYEQADSELETIAAIGTYAAPTASKARLQEVSDSLHPGIIEIQLADSLFSTASAKSLIISMHGAADLQEMDCQVQLLDATPEVTLSTANGTELSACPAATASQRDQLQYLFTLARNKLEETASGASLYKDNGSDVLCESTSSDDTTTFTRGESAAP